MIISQLAQQERKASFNDLFILPFFHENNHIKGSQFVFREDDLKLVIPLLDQELNTIYQQQTDTIQYGHQRFLLAEDSHEDYILLISSQLKQRVYMNTLFDNSESFWIHNKVCKKLLSMQLAKFEYFVLNDDFELLMRQEFYQGQEVLEGKSINDLCLTFPREVAQGLKQSVEQFSNIRGSLVEEVCNADLQVQQYYEQLDLCEQNLLIQVDFNFSSTIRIAAELNQNQSVKILLEKLFELNDIRYQEILMLELPRMLQLPRIERLYDFLERDYSEAKEIEKQNQEAIANGEKQMKAKFLNFEDYLNHPDLPPFLQDKVNYHVKERFKDYHNAEQEVIKEIVDKNPYMTFSIANCEDAPGVELSKRQVVDKNIEVEHSAIDFQKLIIGEKIRYIQEQSYRKVNFNDNHLANVFFVEDDEYLSFYNLEAVRKIIDFQFLKTKQFLQYTFLFYIGGFMIPYILTLDKTVNPSSQEDTFNPFVPFLLYTLCLFTQIFFIIFEVLQLKEQRLDYFKDYWNLLDSSQFVVFCLLYITKMLSYFQNDTFWEICLQAILLFQTFYKTFYFIRIFDSFSFIFTMSQLIIEECTAFLILMILLLLGMCKQYTVMHMGVGEQAEYGDIQSRFIQLMIQTYRAAAGDINVPQLDGQMQSRFASGESGMFYHDVLMFMNTFVWAT